MIFAPPNMGTSFQVEYKPTPILSKIVSRLNDKGRHALEKAGARAASVPVQKWLRALAGGNP